jgi:hypothetical protein
VEETSFFYFVKTTKNAKWLTYKHFSSSTFKKEMESMCEDITIERFSDTIVEVKAYNGMPNGTTELMFKIPILVEVKGEGEVKLQIDPKASDVSGETY